MELTTKENEEPTVDGEDTPAGPEDWSGQVKLSGLTADESYTLYKFTSPDDVPRLPTDAIDTAKAAWSKVITATGPTASVDVDWNSGIPAWFIAVPNDLPLAPAPAPTA